MPNGVRSRVTGWSPGSPQRATRPVIAASTNRNRSFRPGLRGGAVTSGQPATQQVVIVTPITPQPQRLRMSLVRTFRTTSSSRRSHGQRTHILHRGKCVGIAIFRVWPGLMAENCIYRATSTRLALYGLSPGFRSSWRTFVAGQTTFCSNAAEAMNSVFPSRMHSFSWMVRWTSRRPRCAVRRRARTSASSVRRSLT
jgi:hypothetical protein